MWYNRGEGDGQRAMREDLVRGAFSFLAAAVTLYMGAEYFDRFLRTHLPQYLAVGLVCAGLALLEARKVGLRVEHLFGLR